MNLLSLWLQSALASTLLIKRLALVKFPAALLVASLLRGLISQIKWKHLCGRSEPLMCAPRGHLQLWWVKQLVDGTSDPRVSCAQSPHKLKLELDLATLVELCSVGLTLGPASKGGNALRDPQTPSERDENKFSANIWIPTCKDDF